MIRKGRISLRGRGAVIALVIGLTACSPSGRSEQMPEQQARNDAAVITIRDTLGKTPGVTKIEVRYSDYITNPGSAHVNLAVESGVDLECIADATIEEVWRSQLDPLNSIRVGVVSDALNQGPGIVRSYNIFDHGAELEAKYGPRPVASARRGEGR